MDVNNNQNQNEIDSRSSMLIGDAAVERLKSQTVVIYGIGGVGGFAAESLARSGIGHIHLVDNDKIDASNLNRQIISSINNIGGLKTEVMKQRIESIRDDVKVTTSNEFVLKDNVEKSLCNIKADYIIDAIDTVTGKLGIIKYANNNNIPIISSMGTGNKLKPEMLEIADIKDTSVCPLCKIMRKELKSEGIENLTVVYSKEESNNKDNKNSRTPGSMAFVPGAAGLIIASKVVRDLIEID